MTDLSAFPDGGVPDGCVSDTARPAPPAAFARLSDLAARLRTTDDPRASVALLLLVALGAGLFWYRAGLGERGAAAAGALPEPSTAAPSAPAPNSSVRPAPTTSTTRREVVVHVAGAVQSPGLLHLATGSRVADAITAAGGPGARADLDRLNLAARLIDGQRIAVARIGEPPPPGPGPDPTTGEGAAGGATPGEPVDLNAATPAQLETLPGVGPATARAILELRTKQGGFRSVRDLLRVPGIGERRFADLKDRVRV